MTASSPTDAILNSQCRRAQKITSAGTAEYVYDLAGHAIAEFNPATWSWNRGEIYAGGGHIATYAGGVNPTTYFIHADWLGTERARSTAAGALYETCTSLPFGDGLSCSAGDPSPLHFTGKQRDTESGLDYFGARYHGSGLGRFVSVDPSGLSVHAYDPQTWNRYMYARDNPLAYVDLNGMWSTRVHDEIIDAVFVGKMTLTQVEILKASSLCEDLDQSTTGSFKHGMRSPADAPCRGGTRPGIHFE